MQLQKVPKRRYQDACPIAHALELIGERWALLVVRELVFGPRPFGELAAGLPGISAKVLTERLDGLDAAGIVQRRKLPPPASVQVYELTERDAASTPTSFLSGPHRGALGSAGASRSLLRLRFSTNPFSRASA